MSIEHRLCISVLLAASALATASSSSAQCPNWEALPPISSSDIPFAVYDFASVDLGSGPELYVAGTFQVAHGAVANRIAKLSNQAWVPLEPGATAGPEGSVQALLPFDDGSGPALFAGGGFTVVGGQSIRRIAKWNGQSWSAVGAGLLASVYALALFDDGSGTKLYAGGSALFSPGTAGQRVAQWDGQTWTPVGAGIDQNVRSLCVFDDGSGPALFAGGDFVSAGTGTVKYIAKWNGQTWSPLGGGMGGNVNDLAVWDDGSGAALYAGGGFILAGGAPAKYIARWDGTSWSKLASEAGFDVFTLLAFDEGSGAQLFAGGRFYAAGDTPVNRIAKWNGTTWSPLGSGIDAGQVYAEVNTLVALNDGSDPRPDLYVGGGFDHAGGLDTPSLAEWHVCGIGIPYCFGDLNSTTFCPCLNFGDTGRGCQNSSGSGGGTLEATGTLQPDTVVLSSTGVVPSALSIFLQGSATLPAPVPFGDGLRCIGGAIRRLYVTNAVGATVSAPSSGAPSITAQSASLGDPIAPGSTRYYQVHYRDPLLAFCTPPTGNSWNVSSGFQITW